MCKLEQPQLRTLYQRYKKDGLEVLSLCGDEDINEAKATVKELKIEEFTVLVSTGKVEEAFALNSYPLNVVVDKDGVIRHYASELDEKELVKVIEPLLKQLPKEEKKEEKKEGEGGK